jgi:hypothetical protein
MPKNGIIRLFLEIKKNAFAFTPKHKYIFELKRTYVSNKTQVHLKQNAFAF